MAMCNCELNKKLEELMAVFKENWFNDIHFLRWSETENSNYLLSFFKDRDIFKDFLNSVLKDNIYCSFKENNFQADIKDLKFNSYNVYKEYNHANAKTDICIEGYNFICVIENKFGSDSHGRKNGKNQCAEYRKYVSQHTDKDIKIFIRLDNEHCKLCIRDDKFLQRKDEFCGYYNAWFGRNVLKTLEKYKKHAKFGKDIAKYCNYLSETTLDPQSECGIVLAKKRKFLTLTINKILKELGYNDKCKYYWQWDEISINKKLFLLKYEYVELSLLEYPDMKKALEQKINEFMTKTKI